MYKVCIRTFGGIRFYRLDPHCLGTVVGVPRGLMSLFRKRDTDRCFSLVLYFSLIFNEANLVHLQGVS